MTTDEGNLDECCDDGEDEPIVVANIKAIDNMVAKYDPRLLEDLQDLIKDGEQHWVGEEVDYSGVSHKSRRGDMNTYVPKEHQASDKLLSGEGVYSEGDDVWSDQYEDSQNN